MSHYFDDIFHRHMGGMQTPKSQPTSPRLRRTSTSRSIANRSDFDLNGSTVSGYATTDAASEIDGESGDHADADPYGESVPRRSSATHLVDPARLRERQEADRHLHTYISNRLERVKLEKGVDADDDEFEATP